MIKLGGCGSAISSPVRTVEELLKLIAKPEPNSKPYSEQGFSPAWEGSR